MKKRFKNPIIFIIIRDPAIYDSTKIRRLYNSEIKLQA